MTVKKGKPTELDCGCSFCHGEGVCSSCPYCLDRIYEHDHPGMETFMFGGVGRDDVEAEVCPRCQAAPGEPCRRPNGELLPVYSDPLYHAYAGGRLRRLHDSRWDLAWERCPSRCHCDDCMSARGGKCRCYRCVGEKTGVWNPRYWPGLASKEQ